MAWLGSFLLTKNCLLAQHICLEWLLCIFLYFLRWRYRGKLDRHTSLLTEPKCKWGRDNPQKVHSLRNTGKAEKGIECHRGRWRLGFLSKVGSRAWLTANRVDRFTNQLKKTVFKLPLQCLGIEHCPTRTSATIPHESPQSCRFPPVGLSGFLGSALRAWVVAECLYRVKHVWESSLDPSSFSVLSSSSFSPFLSKMQSGSRVLKGCATWGSFGWQLARKGSDQNRPRMGSCHHVLRHPPGEL